MNASDKGNNNSMSTISGTALIVSVLSLILVGFKVYVPQEQVNENVEQRLSQLEAELIQTRRALTRARHELRRQVFEAELGTLAAAKTSLETILSQSVSQDVRSQAKVAQEEIERLIQVIGKADRTKATAEASSSGPNETAASNTPEDGAEDSGEAPAPATGGAH